MNKNQKSFAIQLTIALASKNPTIEQEQMIVTAAQKTPKLYAICLKLVPKVRQRVAENMAATWMDDLTDSRNWG